MWRFFLPLTLLTSFAIQHSAFAAPLVLYVSENGDNRIAIYRMDEATGELTRAGAADLPGAPGSLCLSPDGKHLHASVRSTKQFATLNVDPKTGALSDPTFADAGMNASYVYVDKTGRWLLSAAYIEGRVAVSALKNGRVEGAPVFTLETGNKAHSIQTDSTNRFAFVPHVGELNKVEQLRFDAEAGKLTRNDPPQLSGGEPGAAPFPNPSE
jgi:6-phosphogluconolactonase